MTPEAQRIAIAEAWFTASIKKDGMRLFQWPAGTEGYRGCDLSGWWIYKRNDGSLYGTNWPSADECRIGNIAEIAKRNDYLADLNTMHEAEKALTPENRPEYLLQLSNCATRGFAGLYPVDENYLTHHATAAQRAEAFLRTIGKWKD